MKGGQQATAYLVFTLRACGNADTELIKICPRNPDAEAAILSGVARLKADWGKHSAPRRLVISGERTEGGREARG
jgi:hypothetical protein